MTDSPYGVTPGGTWPPPGPPATWPTPASKQSRAPVIISLVVALIAIAVAIGAWFRPTPETPAPADAAQQFSDQQVAEAKKAVCAAHDLVNRASMGSGIQKSDDPTMQWVIAVNVRLAGSLSAQYLQTKIDQFPATPADLKAAVQQLITSNQDIALLQIANAPKEEVQSFYPTLDSADSKVNETCK
jgi:hypothetical protein